MENPLVKALINDDFKLADKLVKKGIKWPFSNSFIKFGSLNSERINDFLIEKKLIIIPEDISVWDDENHMSNFNNYNHYIINKDLRIKQYNEIKEKIKKSGIEFNELDLLLVDACYNLDIKNAKNLINRGAKWVFREVPTMDFYGSKIIIDLLFENMLIDTT